MSRPRVYRLPAAAERLGVSERTVRSWMRPPQAGRPARPLLRPLPGSLAALGYYLFAEPDLVACERARGHGRPLRRNGNESLEV